MSATAPLSRRSLLTGALLSPLARGGNLKKAPPRIFDAAVIGAGVFGAWTAWHLARYGMQVVLIDAYGPGNGLSSSGGETRVTRMAYGPDSIYTRLSQQSLNQWKALDQRQRSAGKPPVFFQTGVLWLSRARNDYFDHSLKNLEQHGVPHQLFATTEALAERWPQIDLRGIHTGFLEPHSGALAARLATAAVVREALAMGVRYIPARAAGPVSARPASSRLVVPLTLSGGGSRRLAARHVVYACGAWLPTIFPDLLPGRIIPTRQEVFYLDLKALSPALAARYEPARLPVWADFNDGDVFYGIPDVAGYGFKIAHDKHGAVMDPDTDNRRAGPGAVAAIRTYLRKRFPEIAAAPISSVRVCQYENTANGDFLLDRHPRVEGAWLVGGGSGHGFKHGPAVGQYMADLITGKRQATHPRFSLVGKGTVQKREVI